MTTEQFEIVWWWHALELITWIMLLIMFRRWWKGEKKAELQRSDIRERLMKSMRSIVETQEAFLEKITEIDDKLDSLTPPGYQGP